MLTRRRLYMTRHFGQRHSSPASQAVDFVVATKHVSHAILEELGIGLGRVNRFVTRPRPILRSSIIASDRCFVATTTSPPCKKATCDDKWQISGSVEGVGLGPDDNFLFKSPPLSYLFISWILGVRLTCQLIGITAKQYQRKVILSDDLLYPLSFLP